MLCLYYRLGLSFCWLRSVLDALLECLDLFRTEEGDTIFSLDSKSECDEGKCDRVCGLFRLLSLKAMYRMFQLIVIIKRAA